MCIPSAILQFIEEFLRFADPALSFSNAKTG